MSLGSRMSSATPPPAAPAETLKCFLWGLTRMLTDGPYSKPLSGNVNKCYWKMITTADKVVVGKRSAKGKVLKIHDRFIEN
jgi:hypothetical protein